MGFNMFQLTVPLLETMLQQVAQLWWNGWLVRGVLMPTPFQGSMWKKNEYPWRIRLVLDPKNANMTGVYNSSHDGYIYIYIMVYIDWVVYNIINMHRYGNIIDGIHGAPNK